MYSFCNSLIEQSNLELQRYRNALKKNYYCYYLTLEGSMFQRLGGPTAKTLVPKLVMILVKKSAVDVRS